MIKKALIDLFSISISEADKVIKELISINLIRETDEIVFLDTIDIKYAYVIFDKERKSAIQSKIFNRGTLRKNKK